MSITGVALTSIGVLMVLLMIFVFVLRTAKYGTIRNSLRATFVGGVGAVDRAGNGDIVELVGWHQNEDTKKWRLHVNSPERFTDKQTQYIFNSEDFRPPPEEWTHFTGTIICYWDWERKVDYRNSFVTGLTEQNLRLKSLIEVHKRAGKSLIEYVEKQKVDEAKEGANLHNAKVYKTIKSLVDETNVDNVEPGINGENADAMLD